MDAALQALTYERRSGVVTIRGRRFRITEPRPRVASVILTHLGRMLRPWVVRILGGQVTRFVDPVCPACGSTKAEQINGQRWLCQTPGDDGKPCATIWPRETLLDDQGQPARLTLATAMQEPGWRALFALEVGRTIDDLDPEEAHALALRMVLAGTEYDPAGTGASWVPVADEKALDMALSAAGIGGMGIIRLAKAHLEIWALPSLVDDWSENDTSPASSTTATPGGSDIPPPEPPAHAPAGRVPPRTRRRQG